MTDATAAKIADLKSRIDNPNTPEGVMAAYRRMLAKLENVGIEGVCEEVSRRNKRVSEGRTCTDKLPTAW